jgi:hypothetical protein
MRIAPLCLCLLIVLPAHIHASATPACAQSVHLNEIMAGPARDWDGNGTFSSRDDEWVEIVNTGAMPVDLAGFIISDGDSIPRYALSGTLGAGARQVVFGGQSHAWEQANGYPAFGLSLANGGDSVVLWQIVGADTVVVDAYAFRSHEAAPDRAIGRMPDGSGAWVIFDALNPYTGATPPQGNGCAPTPGSENLCDLTPARALPWGRLKAAYR